MEQENDGSGQFEENCMNHDPESMDSKDKEIPESCGSTEAKALMENFQTPKEE